MNFKKGQQVAVTDYRGRSIKRVVWEDIGNAVFITSPEVLKRLEKGDFSLIPIRFPKASVSAFRGR
jgi:hypothetical protein